jgi:hypothetical protein
VNEEALTQWGDVAPNKKTCYVYMSRLLEVYTLNNLARTLLLQQDAYTAQIVFQVKRLLLLLLSNFSLLSFSWEIFTHPGI